jgi:hypothetical protein
MEAVTKTSLVRRINRRVVWGPRGFTDGKTNFSVRDINYSLKDFEKNNGFRIKPTFAIYSSDDSDNCSDTSEGSDTSEDSSKASHHVTREESKEGKFTRKKKETDTSEGTDTSEDSSKASHHVTREDEEGKKKEKCVVCGKVFRSKVHLSNHRNRVHSQTKIHCPKCPKSYSRTDSLSRHLASHHQ